MHKSENEVAQSCPTLSDSINCSLPGSSIHAIFQARLLEWVAIAFTLQSSSHLLAIYSEPGEESPRRPWRTRKSICFLSPVPPKSALCQVVLWTECVFFKFVCSSNSCFWALTTKVLCFEKGSNLLLSHGLWPTRLHCPWEFSGKNTGVDCHFLLQRIFLIQASNPFLLHLMHWPSVKQIVLYPESSFNKIILSFFFTSENNILYVFILF